MQWAVANGVWRCEGGDGEVEKAGVRGGGAGGGDLRFQRVHHGHQLL